LIRNSEETIKKLQEEIGVLRKEIVVLQSRAKENETTKIALISALRTEIDLERERREQAEAERNYLLEIFNERKVPYPDFSDLIRASSPSTAEYIKEERFRDYNSWQEALAGFVKVKDQKKMKHMGYSKKKLNF
jgi:hypothetical protein